MGWQVLILDLGSVSCLASCARGRPLELVLFFSGLEAPSGVLRLMGIPSVVLLCSDISAPSSAISNYYNPDVIHLGDVWGIEEDALPAVDLVLLGPLCQPFSTLVTNRTEVDPRAGLFARGCQLATATRAPLSIVEEVRTILRGKCCQYWKAGLRLLRKAGYQVSWNV